jgi:hypothetical protein
MLLAEEIEELTDGFRLFEGVSEVRMCVDFVPISSAISLLIDDFGVHQVADDTLNRSLGNPDLEGNGPQRLMGVAVEAHQHVRVVRQESPR